MSITVTQSQLLRIEDTMDISVQEDVLTDYVGRGYSAKKCLAYTGSSVAEFTAVLALVLADEEATAFDLVEMIAEIGDGRRDTLGRGEMIYWEHITVEEDDESDD